MKKSAQEFEISKREESTVIKIPATISETQKTLLVSWVLAWTFCGIFMLYSLFGEYSKEMKLMMMVYMVFWAYYEFKVLKTLFWRLWGVEFIRINNEGVDYKRDIRGYGKNIKIFKENLRKIEMLKIENSPFLQSYFNSFWIFPPEKIAIYHLNKHQGIGLGINEDNAKQLISILVGEIKHSAGPPTFREL